MKGIILLANGFEDVEMIATLDLLRRASIEVSTVGVMNQENILSQSKVTYKCDYLLKDINIEDYDFLIIPGGKAVFNDLDKPIVEDIVTSFVKRNKLIGTICAAPRILGKMGLLKNKEFTCFPSVESDVIEGIYIKEAEVVRTGNYITSRSAGTAIPFGLKIIEAIKGIEEANRIKQVIYYNVKM
jgi:4-methyl-5(b-hydroxyethyl)-thiazole monophosphate biosynthesis